jgi:hypothetical protein
MSDEAHLAASLTGVREVVETFRYHGVALPAWTDVLGSAVKVLTSSDMTQISSAAADEMVRELRQLLDTGLGSNPELLADLAAKTGDLLDSTRPAAIPLPSDEDWAFPLPTSASS